MEITRTLQPEIRNPHVRVAFSGYMLDEAVHPPWIKWKQHG